MGKDLEIIVLDNLCAGKFENVSKHTNSKNFRFVRGDVRNSDLVRSLIKNVDAVFHQAAIVSVPKSLEEPVLVNEVNASGTLNLLKACVDCNVKRFVYASSSAVYGEVERMPIKEDCAPRPLSPYGVSKLSAESYVRVFWEVFGLETICLRYFNVYGPRQAPSEYSGVLTQFMDRLARNLGLVIYGDGEQTRDFVHVYDVIEANILALRTKQAAGETFNVGTGIATTINQLADMLLEITNKNHLGVTHSRHRKGEIKHSAADISKAKVNLRYQPKISLKEGLKNLTERSCIQK